MNLLMIKEMMHDPPKPDPPLAKPKVFNSIKFGQIKIFKTSLTIG